VDFVDRVDGRAEQLVAFANQLVGRRSKRMFMYADADVKFDQPQTEVVFNRDKVRSQGVEMSEAGKTCPRSSRNYVNRFSIQAGATR